MRVRARQPYPTRAAARATAFPGSVLSVSALIALAMSCSSGNKGPTTPTVAPSAVVATAAGPTIASAKRPVGVPVETHQVQSPVEYAAGGGGAPDQLFFSQTCRDGILSVVTTAVALYAELPCDRALPQNVVERFLGKPVRLRVAPGSPGKLYVESATAGTVEFTIGSAWVH